MKRQWSWTGWAEKLVAALSEAARYLPLAAVWAVVGPPVLARVLHPAWVVVLILAGQLSGRHIGRLERRRRRAPVIFGLCLAGTAGFMVQPGAGWELLVTPGLAWLGPVVISMLLWVRGLQTGGEPADADTQQGRFFSGLLLVAAAALWGQVALPRDREFGAVAGIWVLVYLVSGLASVALARLRELRQEGRADQEFRLARYWPVAVVAGSGLLLGLALLVAGLLPGVTGALYPGVRSLGRVAGWFLGLLMLPLAYLVEALVWLFKKLIRPFQRQTPDVPLGPPEPLEFQQPQSLPEPVIVAIQWVVVAVVVAAVTALALYYMFRLRPQDEGEWEEERVSTWSAGALAGWWTHWKSGWTRRAARLAGVWRQRSARPRTLEQVYLALLAKAGRLGQPRAPQQTPHEFLPALRLAFPEHRAEVEHVTAAFVHHYYSSTRPEGDAWSRLAQYWASLEAWEPGREPSRRR